MIGESHVRLSNARYFSFFVESLFFLIRVNITLCLNHNVIFGILKWKK